jgi:alkylhydroperoxidase/carboxymuconolactone decarboxylase family protein YurZ
MSKSMTLFVAALLGTLLLVTGSACVSSKVDPRCSIQAPSGSYRAKLAQSVNGSKFWQTYFNLAAPIKEGAKPLIAIKLDFDRKVFRKSNEGDYDDGRVKIDFTVTHLPSRALLYETQKEAKLDMFIIGNFDANATREEIQDAAFKETEEDVFPYIDRWINIAAIRAMGEEGTTAFLRVLEEEAQNYYAEDLMSEARLAIKKIQGGS